MFCNSCIHNNTEKNQLSTALAKTMLLKDFDVVCLTETWLISEIHDQDLHLAKHKLFRGDRSATNYKRKQSGILIGLANNIPIQKLTLNINHEGKAIKISCDAISVKLCCFYNPTSKSTHIQPYEAILILLDQKIQHQKDGSCLATNFVGDIYFDKTT